MRTIPQVAHSRGLEPIHPRDRVWLQDRPTNLMVINSVYTLETLAVEDLRRVWQERVLDVDGGRRYARFRKRVVATGSSFYWQPEADFDITRHIFVVDDHERWQGREGLQAYLGDRASTPLDMSKPPWEFHLFPDFGGGESAVITRLHHVIGDGMGLLPVIFALMDVGEDGAQEPPKTRGITAKLWQVVLKAIVTGVPLLAKRALRPADRSVFHGPELSGEKRFAWTPAIPLDEIKALKTQLGVTVNDVLMAAVAGGLRRYSERETGSAPRELRLSMPVNVRHPDAEPVVENRFGAVMVDLPVSIDEIGPRLAEIKRRMDRLKRSVEPYVYYGSVSFLLSVLPAAVSQWLVDFYARKCSAVMSNVPGPREPLSIAGRRVDAMLFWVPQRANIGLGISILSCSGDVRIGIYSDVALVPEPARLVADIQAELARVHTYADSLPSNPPRDS